MAAAPIVWPSLFPLPLEAGYTLKPEDAKVSSESTDGNILTMARFGKESAIYQEVYEFQADIFELFVGWYTHTPA